MRPAVVLAATLLACGGGDEPDDACLLLGCLEVATIDVITVADDGALADAWIEVCRNDDCVRGAVPPPSDPYDNAAYLDGALDVRVDLRAATGGFQLVATIEQVAATATDGDRYTIVVRRGDGTVVADSAWTATYTASYPNGPACDRCLHATLTPAS